MGIFDEMLDTLSPKSGIRANLPIDAYAGTVAKMTENIREFHAPQSINPEELGDNLARLVWESFSDFVAEGESDLGSANLGLVDSEGEADQSAIEEALIFIMWTHTRGIQQAFVGRAPGDLLKQSLDNLHSAVFEDMVENGTPKSQIPFFEQRVSARYAEYHQASASSDTSLGAAVARNLSGGDSPTEDLQQVVTERAIAATGPLKDYFEEVKLVD